MRKYDAVLFDMDGTLGDSEPAHHAAFCRVIAPFGRTFTDEEYNQFTGRTDMDIARFLLAGGSIPFTAEVLIERKDEALLSIITPETMVPLPGVIQALTQIEGLGLPAAVASSATLVVIRHMTEAMRIAHFFRAMASGEEVAHSKPAPDVFLLAAARLAVDPRRCIIVEDSENGVRAAKAANAYCIAVPCASTANQDHSAADIIVPSLMEVDFARIING